MVLRMRLRTGVMRGILLAVVLLCLSGGEVLKAAPAVGEGKVFFLDRFEKSELQKDWEIIEGSWEIENEQLLNKDGGMIAISPSADSYVFTTTIKVKEWSCTWPWPIHLMS